MKTIPCLFLSYLFVCLSPYISFAQNCEDCRYLTEIFDSIQVTENIKFGQGVNAVGDTQELFLDIYQPVGDTVQNRPVLLFAFGGAFIRGSKEESYVIKACERYAKAGYVAAAMDYRIGFEVDLNLGDVAMRVFFRAMQDMRASVEYFYYSAKNGNPYAVDTNLIFLGGASAGAISALFMEYCDHPDKIAEIGDTTKLAPLGGFSASSSIFPRQSREVAGILNVAGALTNADWVESGKAPHISAHGDEDGVVPYEDDNQVSSGLGLLGITLEGSYLVDQRAKDVGLCSFLYTIEGGDHPTSSVPPEYFDNIFNRWMPRMHAIINEKTFCCSNSAELNIQGDTEIIEDGNEIDLNTQTIGLLNTAYQWCSLPCTDTGYQPTIQTEASIGQYWIAIAHDSSCQVTDFVRVSKETPEDTSNVKSIEDNLQIQVYPNPVSDNLFVRSETDWNDFRIYDATGKLVLKNNNESIGAGQYNIPVKHLSEGNYILLLRVKNNFYSLQFVKQ